MGMMQANQASLARKIADAIDDAAMTEMTQSQACASILSTALLFMEKLYGKGGAAIALRRIADNMLSQTPADLAKILDEPVGNA